MESGDDILNEINEYAKENNITDKKKGLEIESQIHKNLSKDVSTQRDVTDWLDSVFNRKRNAG